MNNIQNTQNVTDPDLGGYFTVSLLARYRWWLIVGCLVGALMFGIFALTSTRFYQSQSKLIMNLGGESRLSLSAAMFMSGPSGKISTEMQVINSFMMADRVIEKNNLRVDVIDIQSPDSLKNNILSRFVASSAEREDLYNRISIDSFDANTTKNGKFMLVVTPNGFDVKNKWKTVLNNGAFGQEVTFSNIRITVNKSSNVKPGQRYLLDVMSAEKAREIFRNRLSVSIPDDKANIVRIAFEHWNPFLAQNVLSDLVNEYIDYYKSSQTSDIDYLLKYTESEINSTEDKLQSAMAQAQQYQELHNVVDPGAEGSAFIDQLSQLGVQKAQVDIDLNQMNYLHSRINTNDPEQVLNSVSLLSRDFPAEEGIVEKLTTLSTERSRQLTTKTQEHPDVIKLDNQINALTAQLRGAIKSRIKQLQARKSEFDGLIGDIKGKISQLPAAIGDLTMIKSEIAMLQQIKALLTTSQTETSLRLASIETNVRILDEPTLPEKHHKPDVKRGTFLGLILGLFSALFVMVVYEYYRKHFVDLSELVGFAGSRFVGFSPKLIESDTKESKITTGVSCTYNIDKDLLDNNEIILIAPIYSDVKLLLDSISLVCAGYSKRGITVNILNIYDDNYFKSLKSENVNLVNVNFNSIDNFNPSESQIGHSTRFLLPLKSWLGDTEPGIVVKNIKTGIVVFDWKKHSRAELANIISDLKRKSTIALTIALGVPYRLINNKRIRTYLGIH